jgi:peptidoglycan-N-acetylmuramic acid deacetylase
MNHDHTASNSGKPAGIGDDKALSWYYMKKKKGEVPNFPAETKQFKPEQKAVWVGTGKKVYLTFDTGGPLGDTAKLLNTLKDNDVKASFFLAGYNVKAHPDFLKQLVADGHTVANHTMSHKDMTTLTDDQVKKEINDYETMYKKITGQPLGKYFRFPYGKYSKHLLDVVSNMGYTSFFWSTAMHDWDPRKNGADDSYKDVIAGLHDGNIILMHQGSEDNINALDRIIKEIKKEGYEFGTVSDFQ